MEGSEQKTKHPVSPPETAAPPPDSAVTNGRPAGRLYALIPHKASNRLVIRAFELMRRRQRRTKRHRSSQEANEAAFRLHLPQIRAAGGYIEDQNAYRDMRYGRSTVRYSGCEVIAAYNALVSLFGRADVSLPALISVFEKDGMVFSGRFGTSPKAVEEYFSARGLATAFTTDEAEFSDIAERSDSMILTIYNDRDDIRKEVHTVNVSKSTAGYTAHNLYCNGAVPGPFVGFDAMMQAVNGGRAKGISLIGLKKNGG